MRQNKWYPIIFALSIAIIAFASIFNPIEYLTNVANAIALPVLLLTVIELVGHIKETALRELDFEARRANRDEEWLKSYYNIAKDGGDEVSKKTVKDYEELCERINDLCGQIIYVDGWFKNYPSICIFFWVLLLCAALLANLECIIYLTSKINMTVITLFTLAIFIGEPVTIDHFKEKLRKRAIEKVDLTKSR